MNKRLDNLSSGLGKSLDTEDLLRKHEIDMNQSKSLKTSQLSKQSSMSSSVSNKKKTSSLTPDQRSPEIDFERQKKDFGEGIFADLDRLVFFNCFLYSFVVVFVIRRLRLTNIYILDKLQ